MAGWMDRRIDRWIDDGWMDRCMDGWVYGRKNGCVGEWIDYWTDGRMKRMEERVGKAGRNIVKETAIEGKVEHIENEAYNLKGGIKVYSDLNLQSCM